MKKSIRTLLGLGNIRLFKNIKKKKIHYVKNFFDPDMKDKILVSKLYVTTMN